MTRTSVALMRGGGVGVPAPRSVGSFVRAVVGRGGCLSNNLATGDVEFPLAVSSGPQAVEADDRSR